MTKIQQPRNRKTYLKPSVTSKLVKFLLNTISGASEVPVSGGVLGDGYGPFRDGPRRTNN